MIETTKQPKVEQKTDSNFFLRGQDKIDKKAFLPKLPIALDFALSNSDLKEKNQDAARKQMSIFINGIQNGTIEYNIDGSFTDKKGILKNADKGFDANGIVAGIIGRTLRSMDAYIEPVDKTKTSWKGSSTVADFINKGIFGDVDPDINNFILQDTEVTNGKRSTRERIKILQGLLDSIYNNLDSKYSDLSDDDKETWKNNYELSKKALEDYNISDNEWLTLIKTTGISNLRDYFANDVIKKEEVAKIPEKGTPEEEVIDQEVPKTVSMPTVKYEVKSSDRYGNWTLNQIMQKVAQLPKMDLYNILEESLIGSDNYEIGYKRLGLTNVNKAILAAAAINLLPNDAKLQLGNYIYFTHMKDIDRKYGLVYDTTTRTLSYLPLTKLKELINVSKVKSNKKGGILKFGDGGGTPKSPFVNGVGNIWDAIIWGDTRYQNYFDNGQWLLKERVNGAEDTPANSAFYKPENLSGTTEGYKPGQHTSVAGLDNPAPQIAGEDSKVFQGNPRYLAYIDYLRLKESDPEKQKIKDQLLIKSLNDYVKLRGEKSDKRIVQHRRADGTWDLEGARKVLFNQTKDKNGRYLGLAYDTKLGIAHDIYRGKTYFLTDDPGTFYRLDKVPEGYRIKSTNKGEYDLIDIIELEKDPNYKGTTKLGVTFNPTEKSTEDEKDPSKVWGKDIPKKKQKKPRNWQSIIPELLAAVRLPWSIHTNNKVARTIDRSLVPYLKNPPEFYSPETGAYGEMMLANQLGSQTLFNSNQPFTSDASLAAARMFDANRQARDLQIRGFLADNKEIKRTKAEALARQEKNIQNRTEVANFNRRSINQTNREKAQLEASRLKSNWQGIDNYLQGLETRTFTKNAEREQRINSFYDRIDQKYASDLYTKLMAPAEAAKKKWLADPKNNGKLYSESPEYETYVAYGNEVSNRVNDALNSRLSERYHLGYQPLYTSRQMKEFETQGWDARHMYLT